MPITKTQLALTIARNSSLSRNTAEQVILQIADGIASAGVTNLVMVSGDAHMVAIDDGSNSGYARDGTPGFPLLHAGALDRPGSVKGGPYSEGAYPGGGQFGRLEIRDDGGDAVDIVMSGHRWDGVELVRYETTLSR